MMSYVPILLLVAAVGCQSDSKPANEQTTNQPEPAAEPQTEEPVEQEAAKLDAPALAPVLEKYEAVRASLAKDDANVAANATALADAVDAIKKSGADGAAHLGPLADAARALSKTSAEDIDAARNGFGELSKVLVDFLAMHPDLQTGLHVFECPMAAGYKKWVQPKEKLENPYMGTKMLECGAKSDWAS